MDMYIDRNRKMQKNPYTTWAWGVSVLISSACIPRFHQNLYPTNRSGAMLQRFTMGSTHANVLYPAFLDSFFRKCEYAHIFDNF